MKHRTLLGVSGIGLALVLAGCSSSAAQVETVDADTLVAGCLNAAIPVAQDSNTFIEGTVSSITTKPEDEGTEVHIIFDARDANGTADPAACTMVVAGESVTDFDLGSPDSDLGAPVEGAVEQWNDNHAEAWVDGGGPEPVELPGVDAVTYE